MHVAEVHKDACAPLEEVYPEGFLGRDPTRCCARVGVRQSMPAARAIDWAVRMSCLARSAVGRWATPPGLGFRYKSCTRIHTRTCVVGSNDFITSSHVFIQSAATTLLLRDPLYSED